MAKGKNKQLAKKGKGGRKVEKHPFVKKEWYKYMSPPSIIASMPLGWTPANKTVGKKIGSDNVLGRVCEVSFADLDKSSRYNWRKVRMQVETVEGHNCYSSFYGLDSTRERVCSLIKKGQSLIDIWTDVKTADGYILRISLTTCTIRKYNQQTNNCYCKSSQVRAIRKVVSRYLVNHAAKSTVAQLANNVLSESLSGDLVTKICKIFPVKVVLITKVKVLKKAKLDVKGLVTKANKSLREGAAAQEEKGKGRTIKAAVDPKKEADAAEEGAEAAEEGAEAAAKEE